jgi:hypothetical protein
MGFGFSADPLDMQRTLRRFMDTEVLPPARARHRQHGTTAPVRHAGAAGALAAAATSRCGRQAERLLGVRLKPCA